MQLPYSLVKAIENYLNGSATPEEQQWVQDWYHSWNDAQVEVPAEVENMRAAIAAKIWERLNNTLQAELPVQMQRTIPLYQRRWFRGSTAAAVLLLLTIAGYWWLFRTPQPVLSGNAQTPATPALHDVAPGGDKALLTLSDGSSIVLDSAVNGLVTQQGNSQVMKLSGGQLQYQSSGGNNLPVMAYNKLSTPRGGQYKLTLSDGSKVWLNAASSIRYPVSFASHERRVEVSGEAYFEIATLRSSSGKVPFIVTIVPEQADGKKATVEVLGTHFNVMAYDDETSMQTTLLEGSVRVTDLLYVKPQKSAVQQQHVATPLNGENPAALLKPGQQALITNNASPVKPLPSLAIQVRNTDTTAAVAWKNGLFHFAGAPVKDMMRQLSRWYDIRVKFDGKIPNQLITGKAPRNLSLATMLKILELSDIHYTIEGKQLTITP